MTTVAIRRPVILDLFCKAGGCSMGYSQAGFDVVGVDIEAQPHYPFSFIKADAIEILKNLLAGKSITDLNGRAWRLFDFDAIHASPPCQAFTLASLPQRRKGKEYPDYIAVTRELLKATNKFYIIENVPKAPLINPILLNAAMFSSRIKRDRLFELNFDFPFTLLPMSAKSISMGRPFDPTKEGTVYPVGHFSSKSAVSKEMGIDWMTTEELAEAIPPAYTRYIGDYLIKNYLS